MTLSVTHSSSSLRMASRISGTALEGGWPPGRVGSAAFCAGFALLATSSVAGASSASSSTFRFSKKTKRLQARRRDSGVRSWPMPITSSPSSRMRLAKRVKSLSDDTSAKPSTRSECRRSMASITKAMSEEFLPFVYAGWWCGMSACSCRIFRQPFRLPLAKSP